MAVNEGVEGGGGEGGGLSESIKKGKFRTKIFFFQIILDEVEKICGKWYLDVKANIKQEIKDLVVVSYKFL